MENIDYSKIELYVACRNLKNEDTLSKNDPQVHLSIKNKEGEWELHSKTEVIKENLDPDFVKTFLVDFIFEKEQHVKFDVFDIDDETKEDKDRIGSVETTISSLFGARNQTSVLKLTKKKNEVGSMIIRVDKQKSSWNEVFFKIGGGELVNIRGFFSKTISPFLRIKKL
jgi:copine 1/2/3